MEPDGEFMSICPSFTSYSADKFAETASRVAKECAGEADLGTVTLTDLIEDDDFEFSLVRSDVDFTADEMFPEGQVQQIFPVFNRDLLNDDEDEDRDEPDVSTIRLPLKNLFMADRDERDDPPSSSSSEVDELESVPPDTYCVWRPKEVEASPSRCKKSNSTGSASKRWKFLNLLRRSNSDGKDDFVFLTPKNREQQAKLEISKERRHSTDAGKGAGKAKMKGVSSAAGKVSLSSSPASAHEVFYVRNRASKEEEKRKSYLPYRQDLVGFFANVKGMKKTFPPF